MDGRNFYGNFEGYNGELSDVPVVSISSDPEHMIEFAGYGREVVGHIAPYRTFSLNEIDWETDTEILTYGDKRREVVDSGRGYFTPMSEEGLTRKAFDGEREGEAETVFDDTYDPIKELFSREVMEMLEDVEEEFGVVQLYPYMMTSSLREEELREKTGLNIEVLGPDYKTMEGLRNKAEVKEELFERGVSIVDGHVTGGPDEACEILVEEDWERGAFVSAETGAGGSGTIYAHTVEDIQKRFQEEYFDGRLLVERFVDVDKAPNVLLFVDDERSYTLSVTNQIIEGKTNYMGNRTTPGLFSKEERAQIEEESCAVGEYIREEGYRGLAGLDLITTDDGIYFVEINPRKNHSTVLNVGMLAETRPEDFPPLPALEAESLLGISDGYDLDGWQEPDLSWEMYLLKRKGWSRLTSLPPTTGVKDHEWDFEGGYVANVPFPVGSIVNKNYASQKSEGHTRRSTANELVRIVSTDLNTRLKALPQVENCFENIGE